MKKTIILIILGVVTVGCIIFGTFRHIGFWFGKDYDSKGFAVYNDYDEDADDADGKTGRFNQTLNPFSEIKINVSIGAIRIQEGSEYHIESVYNKPFLQPRFEVVNGQLQINQQIKKGKSGNQNCKIVITVPPRTDIKLIDIESNVGDVDVRDITGDELEVSLNVGEVELHNIDFNDIDVNNNVGEVSIRLTDDVDNYTLRLSSDIGAVSVKGNSYKHHYESKGDTSKKISASTNVGAVSVR